MSFHSTINFLNSLLILLSIINFISTEAEVEVRDSVNNRESLIREIDGRRAGIQYVVQVLKNLDRSLANVEKSDETLEKRAFDCSPIGGLPGADCEWNEMGVEAKAQKIMKNSIRNPGRKRRSLLKLFQRMP